MLQVGNTFLGALEKLRKFRHVRRSTWNNSARARRILMKLDI